MEKVTSSAVRMPDGAPLATPVELVAVQARIEGLAMMLARRVLVVGIVGVALLALILWRVWSLAAEVHTLSEVLDK